MFVPGFISSAVGLLLMVPPVRALLRPFVAARVRAGAERAQSPHGACSVRLRRPVRSPARPGGSVATTSPIDVDSDPSDRPRLGHGRRAPSTTARARRLTMVADP